MIKATVRLKSISPYSQSRHYETEKLPKELSRDYEDRTWRDRLHADAAGMVFIPGLAFKNALSDAAQYLGVQIPGRGKSTYKKHIDAGVLVLENVPLGIAKTDVDGEWVFVPSDGVRGSGKRVMKCFPVLPEWEAEVAFHVLDHLITKDVFEQHLTGAGSFIGIGRWRPRNNGLYGRFQIVMLEWQEVSL